MVKLYPIFHMLYIYMYSILYIPHIFFRLDGLFSLLDRLLFTWLLKGLHDQLISTGCLRQPVEINWPCKPFNNQVGSSSVGG